MAYEPQDPDAHGSDPEGCEPEASEPEATDFEDSEHEDAPLSRDDPFMRVITGSDTSPDLSRDIRQYLRSGGEADVHFENYDGLPAAVRRVRATAQHDMPSPPAAWDHPHLVKILSDAEDVYREEAPAGTAAEDTRRLVMEAVPGGSAADLIEARGSLPVGEAVTLLVPIAQALTHLHAHGAVHGDVSAQNVMFRADGAPVLIDPGNARSLGAAPAKSFTEGFAPAEEVADQARDVWGWGALAWFVVTGELPVAAEHRVPLPLTVKGIDERFAQLIDDCLSVDPRERPAAEELAPEVLAVQEPEPLNIDEAVRAEGRALMLTQHRPGKRAAGARLGSRLRGAKITPTTAIIGVAALGMLTVAGLMVFAGPRSQDAAQATQTTVAKPVASASSTEDAPGKQAGSSQRASEDERLTRADVEKQLKARMAALKQRDVAALDKVYTVKAAGLKSDRQMLEKMQAEKQRFAGVEMKLERVSIDTKQKKGKLASAVVEVKLKAHSIETETGRVVSREAGRTDVLDVGFKRVGRSWKIETIAAAAKPKG